MRSNSVSRVGLVSIRELLARRKAAGLRGLRPALQEVLEGLLDELGGGGVGVGGGVELDGEIATVVCGFGDVEGFFQVDGELFAVVVNLAVFDVGDVVGALEHGFDGAVVGGGVVGEDRVGEIGQRAEVGTVHGVDDFDDEEGVFGDGVVVFQRNYDIFLRGVGGDFAEAAGGAGHIGGGVFRAGDVGANAWGVEHDGYVHPFFCGVDGLTASGGIGVVEALANVSGDIHDVCIRLLQGLAELFEVGGVGGLEVFG